MDRILQSDGVDKLPVEELLKSAGAFMALVEAHLPEKRLRDVSRLAVQGLLGGASPLVTQIARGVVREEASIRPMARRIYRFLWNERFSHRELLKGLYSVAQRVVAQHTPAQLVVAVDPVNFEKPYTEELEGVSTALKSTPPDLSGDKRLTSWYPAITAIVVNLPEPVATYANWFSYVTVAFVSENREIYRAIRITRALFPQQSLCFVGDAGLDDRKIIRWMGQAQADFIIRACHNRTVEVYNDRLDRWETELLDDLTATVPLSAHLQVTFTHARERRTVIRELGWLNLRRPSTQQELWALVVHDPGKEEDLVLITNVPVESAQVAKTVYTHWATRAQVEHTYRFDQEDGLDVEDVCVQTLERIRRVFVLLLLAVLFVYHVAHTWPRDRRAWLRYLGGKLGTSSDRDGPYLLLAGIQAVFVTCATKHFAARYPFSRPGGTYG
jgi:hypothetical protein